MWSFDAYQKNRFRILSIYKCAHKTVSIHRPSHSTKNWKSLSWRIGSMGNMVKPRWKCSDAVKPWRSSTTNIITIFQVIQQWKIMEIHSGWYRSISIIKHVISVKVLCLILFSQRFSGYFCVQNLEQSCHFTLPVSNILQQQNNNKWNPTHCAQSYFQIIKTKKTVSDYQKTSKKTIILLIKIIFFWKNPSFSSQKLACCFTLAAWMLRKLFTVEVMEPTNLRVSKSYRVSITNHRGWWQR